MSYHDDGRQVTPCICPKCKQKAEFEEAGAGRFFWACRTCEWESDEAPIDLMDCLGKLISMNCVGAHFYNETPEEPAAHE